MVKADDQTTSADVEKPATRFAKDQLKAIVERIERLEEEKKALSDDIRDVYAEAKGNGYDVKAPRANYLRTCAALHTIITLRKMHTAKPELYERKSPMARTEARIDAYLAIDTERDYQNAGAGNARRDPPSERTAPLTLGESILVIEKLLGDACFAWYTPGGRADALDHIRKIAAVAVACMETHGAPKRIWSAADLTNKST